MNNNIKKIDKDKCAICLEELISNIAVLDCDHKYHFDCIQLWYDKKRESGSFLNCPLCNNIGYNNLSYFEKLSTLKQLRQ